VLELLVHQPIFIGFKADSGLRRQIEPSVGLTRRTSPPRTRPCYGSAGSAKTSMWASSSRTPDDRTGGRRPSQHLEHPAPARSGCAAAGQFRDPGLQRRGGRPSPRRRGLFRLSVPSRHPSGAPPAPLPRSRAAACRHDRMRVCYAGAAGRICARPHAGLPREEAERHAGRQGREDHALLREDRRCRGRADRRRAEARDVIHIKGIRAISPRRWNPCRSSTRTSPSGPGASRWG